MNKLDTARLDMLMAQVSPEVRAVFIELSDHIIQLQRELDDALRNLTSDSVREIDLSRTLIRNPDKGNLAKWAKDTFVEV